MAQTPEIGHCEPPAKKRRSLSASMALLLTLCWVLPILLMVGISGVSSARAIRQHVTDVVAVSIQGAMDNLGAGLDGAVSDSLNASYNAAIRTAYGAYVREIEKQGRGNKLVLTSKVRAFLAGQYTRNNRLRGAYVLFSDIQLDEEYRCFVFNPDSADYNDVQSFYASGAPAQALALIPELGTGIAFVEAGGRVYLVRVLSLTRNTLVPYAALVLELDMEQLLAGVRAQPWITGAAISLDGTVLPVVGDGYEADFSRAAAQESPATTGAGNLIRVEGGLRCARFQLMYSVEGDIQPMVRQADNPQLVIMLALMAVPLMALVYVFFYRKVTRPVNTLASLAHRIEDGEFNQQVDAEQQTSAEFYSLATDLNAMSARLEFQFERLYREELALRDARIKALQSQINPHFLGNTLEIINWEARMAGNVKVSRMLEALSTMLEATLDRRRRPLIHLSEEMMYVNSYLYIIGERMGKRLEVVQEIDPDLLDEYVPRLILQPIIENAVEHGASGKARGVIIIRAKRGEKGWMNLEVENNSPMSKEDEDNVRQLLEAEGDPEGESSGNIGIRNVHQRLRILYGPKSGLSVKNSKNGGTISSMCVQL